MTQDEIYEMAHQAGVENEFNYDFRLSLEAFAKLVAAKEREAFAKEKTLQALHSENERLGLYKDAYAQRTWVGLTDEEYNEIWRMDLNNKDIMDKTIAKLKEKNT